MTSDLPKPHSNSILSKFRYAVRGIAWTFNTQINMRIHGACTVLVVLFGIVLNISPVEWCLVIFASGLVLTLETVNTGIEAIVDFISPEYQTYAKNAKDAAAGAVLLAAITSLIIGLIVFLPKLF